MTITQEQFNKLVTKEDLKNFYKKEEMDKLNKQILSAIDTIMRKLDNIEHAVIADQAAHARFEIRLERIEKHLGLKPMFN